MPKLKELENEVKKIKERNKRVEADKSWETSVTRKIIIAIATYFVIALFLWSANIPNPFLNAIVPTVAFVLSTLTLTVFKKIWLKRFYKKE